MEAVPVLSGITTEPPLTILDRLTSKLSEPSVTASSDKLTIIVFVSGLLKGIACEEAKLSVPDFDA